MGFFSIGETKGTRKKKAPSCRQCGLLDECQTPRMPVAGKGKRKILIVGEYPTRLDDKAGVPFAGPGGQLLESTLKDIGINLRKDCWLTHAVNCRPPKDEEPNGVQIDACRRSLYKCIEKRAPSVIVALGQTALTALLPHAMEAHGAGILKWQGWEIPDRVHGTWVHPTFAPKYVLKETKNNGAIPILWKKDLVHACANTEYPFPQYKREEDCIEFLHKPKDIIRFLKKYRKAYKGNWFAFDYETTGLKPHAKGHRILCVGIAIAPDRAYAFPLGDKKVERALKELLADPYVHKVAGNIKFEESWSRHCLGTPVEGWLYDSVLGAHVLDNRSGVSNVKFQAYVTTGVCGYDKAVEDYIAGDSKNANSFNRMDKLHLRDLLTYVGIDALVEYRTAKKHMEIIGI